MTSIPASRRARATTFAPRSWPSSPGLAMSTRIGAAVEGFSAIVATRTVGAGAEEKLCRGPRPSPRPASPLEGPRTAPSEQLGDVEEEVAEQRRRHGAGREQDDERELWRDPHGLDPLRGQLGLAPFSELLVVLGGLGGRLLGAPVERRVLDPDEAAAQLRNRQRVAGERSGELEMTPSKVADAERDRNAEGEERGVHQQRDGERVDAEEGSGRSGGRERR